MTHPDQDEFSFNSPEPPQDPVRSSETAGYICTLLATLGVSAGMGNRFLFFVSLALAAFAIPGFFLCAATYRRRKSILALAAVALNLFLMLLWYFLLVSLFSVIASWRQVDPGEVLQTAPGRSIATGLDRVRFLKSRVARPASPGGSRSDKMPHHLRDTANHRHHWTGPFRFFLR